MMTSYRFRTFALRLLRQTIAPVVGVVVISYFAWHTVQGDRGLVALTRLQGEVADAERNLASVRGEREEMERRARLLRQDNLDPDMLEERARALLNMTHPDEQVILLPRRADPLAVQGNPVQPR